MFMFSILLFMLYSSLQITNAQTKIDGSEEFINNLIESEDSLKLDTLEDGTISIEIIRSDASTQNITRQSISHRISNSSKVRLFCYTLLVIIIIGILIYLYIDHLRIMKRGKNTHNKYLQNLQIFKQQADKIPVYLANCKIKQRTRYEEINKTHQRLRNDDALDALIFDIQRNDKKEIKSCTITYQDRGQTFSTNIEKDELTIRILFGLQEITYIYVNKNNKKDYYFDLDFLDR